MVTPADLVTLQQQLRQEIADVIQQLRAEVNEAISGRMDMMNSISAALQRMTAKPAESKPYRISDLIPRNWEGGNEKGEFRSFMSDLHLWMQAWSDQGEQMLAMVESIDRFDNNVMAFDCSDEEFRSIESALYQVLHRTTVRRDSKHGTQLCEDMIRGTCQTRAQRTHRFRGTTMSYSELIVALENIIIDKVAMVPIAKGKRHDTSAPMEI